MSAKTVPIPVSMASDEALNLWASSRDSSEVIHLLSPLVRPMPPSREQAILQVMKGRFREILEKKPRFCSIDMSSQRPVFTFTPAFFKSLIPS